MSNRTRLTQEQVDKAVEWWSGEIQSPKLDNGDASEAGALTVATATMATKSIDPESVKKFSDALRSLLSDKNIIAAPHGSIGCDYGPDRVLSQAAAAAGIPGTNFPWKTMMFFGDGVVKVSHGYQAELKEL